MSGDSLECPQQPAALREIPVGSVYPLVYPPAQVFKVRDTQKNYHCVCRLNVLNTYDVSQEPFLTLASVAPYI